ncbi:hypothetical protein HDV06_002813 [Boothiomyces sp. JEL0866]|nr:hypothetical protein HDV06_002813 [Boothiomyces sp. JEL0866]
MQLQDLPLDLLENNIFKYLDALAIQQLSFANKRLYKRIGPTLLTLLSLGLPILDIYPALALPYHQRKDVLYQYDSDAPVLSVENTEKYKQLQKVKWKFPVINIPINLYSKIYKYLPASCNIEVTVHHDFNINEFAKTVKKRITSMVFNADRLIDQVDDEHIFQLLQFLPSSSVNGLEFQFQLFPPMVEKLSESLTGIKELFLQDCFISDEGLETLLDHIDNVQTLDLQNNALTDSSIIKLANKLPKTEIKRLTLALNSMERPGMEAISKALPKSKIEEIDIDKNALADGNLEPFFSVFPDSKLNRFLYGDPISKPSQKLFIHNLKETNITLVYVTINVDLIPDLIESLIHSKVDDLSTFNPITDKGLKYFAKKINDLPLTKLDLDDCEITDKGIKQLFKNLGESRLTELDLSGNPISVDGYEYIVKSLPKTNIKKLYLGNTARNPQVLDYDTAVWVTGEIEVSNLIFKSVPRENDFTKPGILVQFEDEELDVFEQDDGDAEWEEVQE